MAIEADRVVVALIGDTSNLDSSVNGAERNFTRAMSSIERSASSAEKQIVQSSNASAFAARNLGFQLSDIGVQLSGGQSPFLIISQQGPQVVQALQEISASGAGLGQVLRTVALPGFLSILGILGPFVAQLLAGASAAGTKADAMKQLTSAINDMVKSTDAAIASGSREISINQSAANALLGRAQATRELTKAQIQQQISAVSAAQATERNGGGTLPGAGIIGRGAASQDTTLATLRRQLADAEQAEQRAKLAVSNANARAIQQRVTERTDPRAAAQGRYDRELDKLNNLRQAGIVSDAQYEASLTRITEARDRDIKAIGASARAERTRISASNKAAREAETEQKRQAREKARELDQLRARVERLDKQLDPAGASAKEFAADLATIKDAMEAGIITPARAAELQLKQLESALRPIAATIGSVGGAFGSIGQDAGKQAGKDTSRDHLERDKELARQQQEKARNTIYDLADLYESAFTGGTRNLWDDFKRQGLRALALLAAQKTFELITGQALPAGRQSDAGGLFNSIVGSIFGRASGGYVAPGQTVRVNEQRGGVELLRMGSQGGTIVPLGRTDAVRPGGGGMTLHQTVHVDNRGSVNPSGFADNIRKQVREETLSIVKQASQQTLRAVPARMQGYQNDQG